LSLSAPERRERGFGLIILIFLIAFATIALGGISAMYLIAGRQTQQRMDRLHAYHVAQAGVLQALHNFQISNAAKLNRRYATIGPTSIPGTQRAYKAGVQANFAYFTFNETMLGAPANRRTQWALVGTRPQLRRWRIRNISTAATLTVRAVRVSWTANPPASLGSLRTIRLNNVLVLNNPGGVGNGVETAVTLTSLAANGIWGGTTNPGDEASNINTFLEWNGNGALPTTATVNVEWVFNDDVATRDSRTHNVLYWNGTPAVAPTPLRTFSVTSSGGTNVAGVFRIMQTLRATVSAVGAARMEIIGLDTIEKGVP